MLGRIFKRKKKFKQKLQKKVHDFFEQFKYPKYATTEKLLGETPLVATEKLRTTLGLPKNLPLAYAGRLDPMATGKLLILIGKECKKQEKYHGLDKEYKVELLFGISSDSGDVLGMVTEGKPKLIMEEEVSTLFKELPGSITLSYPHFSSKTIKGKPLHTWTLEKKLHEIDIPQKTSTIHKIVSCELSTITKDEIVKNVRAKIDSIPEVTDPRKKLGANFRRKDVHKGWDEFEKNGYRTYQKLTFICVASSGTYMRSLCEYIAQKLGTTGLAYSIHRTTIGNYLNFFGIKQYWKKRY